MSEEKDCQIKSCTVLSVNTHHHTTQENDHVHTDQCPLVLVHTSRCVGHKNLPGVAVQQLVDSIVKLCYVFGYFANETRVHARSEEGASRNPSVPGRNHSSTIVVVFQQCCAGSHERVLCQESQCRWTLIFRQLFIVKQRNAQHAVQISISISVFHKIKNLTCSCRGRHVICYFLQEVCIHV